MRAPSDEAHPTAHEIAAEFGALFERIDVDGDWASGLLSAVHSGPDLVPVSTWAAKLLEQAVLEKEAEAKRVLGLLMRLHDRIGELLATDPAELCPPPGDVESVQCFCRGYLVGVGMHPRWERDQIAILGLTPVVALTGDVPNADLLGPDGTPLADAEAWKRQQREELADHVAALRHHWESARRDRAGAAAGPATRAASKIGRNDRCPCGSGKKYKKCCAA